MRVASGIPPGALPSDAGEAVCTIREHEPAGLGTCGSLNDPRTEVRSDVCTWRVWEPWGKLQPGLAPTWPRRDILRFVSARPMNCRLWISVPAAEFTRCMHYTRPASVPRVRPRIVYLFTRVTNATQAALMSRSSFSFDCIEKPQPSVEWFVAIQRTMVVTVMTTQRVGSQFRFQLCCGTN